MEHVNAWRNTFSAGRVEITGDIQLAKTTWFAQYYILSTLPSRNPFLPPMFSEVYYGAGRYVAGHPQGVGQRSVSRDRVRNRIRAS